MRYECKWCDKPIYKRVLTSPITKRSLTDWYHADTSLMPCVVYGDGWQSEHLAEPEA